MFMRMVNAYRVWMGESCARFVLGLTAAALVWAGISIAIVVWGSPGLSFVALFFLCAAFWWYLVEKSSLQSELEIALEEGMSWSQQLEALQIRLRGGIAFQISPPEDGSILLARNWKVPRPGRVFYGSRMSPSEITFVWQCGEVVYELVVPISSGEMVYVSVSGIDGIVARHESLNIANIPNGS